MANPKKKTVGEEGVGSVTISAMYEKESKRYYRYLVQENELGIVGTIYQSKEKEYVEEVTLKFKK